MQPKVIVHSVKQWCDYCPLVAIFTDLSSAQPQSQEESPVSLRCCRLQPTTYHWLPTEKFIMSSRQRNQKSLLKTLLVGVFFGISVTRTFLSISSGEKDLNRVNKLYELAASDLPTVRGNLKSSSSSRNTSSSVVWDPKNKATRGWIMQQETDVSKKLSTVNTTSSKNISSINQTQQIIWEESNNNRTVTLHNTTATTIERNHEPNPSTIAKNQSSTYSETDNETMPVVTGTDKSIGSPMENKLVETTGEVRSYWKDARSALSGNLTTNATDFERQENVVIVTKIHGPHQLSLLKQSMCLLHYAYNDRVNYDIVVFTAEPIDDKEIEHVRKIVAPAKLDVVMDNDGFTNEVNNLSPIRRDHFLNRCNVTDPAEINWWSMCQEGKNKGRLNYNWQAEFRSWHIWRHPALAQYRYMMWLDTDSFCTKKWDRDPIAIAIKNELALLFGNFPMGRGKGEELQDRIRRSFNDTICHLGLKGGKFHVKTGNQIGHKAKSCSNALVPLVHGFFHITNLDFYRSDPVIQWAETLIGECFLCRKWDDQIAVTVPAAMLAPDRAWDLYAHKIHLEIGTCVQTEQTCTI